MNVHVDRLTLRLSRLSEAESRRLVRLVGENLAIAMPDLASGATDSLRLRVEAHPGEGLEDLSHRIVTEMIRTLAGVSL